MTNKNYKDNLSVGQGFYIGFLTHLENLVKATSYYRTSKDLENWFHTLNDLFDKTNIFEKDQEILKHIIEIEVEIEKLVLVKYSNMPDRMKNNKFNLAYKKLRIYESEILTMLDRNKLLIFKREIPTIENLRKEMLEL